MPILCGLPQTVVAAAVKDIPRNGPESRSQTHPERISTSRAFRLVAGHVLLKISFEREIGEIGPIIGVRTNVWIFRIWITVVRCWNNYRRTAVATVGRAPISNGKHVTQGWSCRHPAEVVPGGLHRQGTTSESSPAIGLRNARLITVVFRGAKDDYATGIFRTMLSRERTALHRMTLRRMVRFAQRHPRQPEAVPRFDRSLSERFSTCCLHHRSHLRSAAFLRFVICRAGKV